VALAFNIFVCFESVFFSELVQSVCIYQTAIKLMNTEEKMLNFKKYAALLALLPVATLWTQAANAETLKTKNFNVTITRNCPEGYVACNNVAYFGKNLKTGKSIRLIGKTIHTFGADGVTPSRFLGYEFRNNQYLYRVTADGALQVYQGKKLILQEKGTFTY
jgi:hypothetical protein